MAQATAIEWTDLSWNPVHGCSMVSAVAEVGGECDHCYAAELSLRRGHTKLPWTAENAAENVILKPHKLHEPVSGAKQWRGLGAAAAAAGKTEGMLVFVNSMSDLFHPRVPGEYIAQVFDVMERAAHHTFQVLTKRPKRMHTWCERYRPEPLPNVWLGTSIGLGEKVGRADHLRETPAAVRFISAEPLLEPLIPRGYRLTSPICTVWQDGRVEEGQTGLDLTGIDWLIVGGESGPGHRPMREEWVRDLRDACNESLLTCCDPRLKHHTQCCRQPDDEGPRTAFFMKQMGGARPGGKLEDLPEDLRIREFPEVAHA